MTNTPTVSLKNVTKIFNPGQPNEVTALKNINLDIWPHEFVSLVGPSGCGKSTLLRLIADLTQPTEGTVQVNGKSAYRARIEQDYGIVFQSPTLYEWRTVAKNVELPLELMKYGRAERRERARKMLQLVELEGFENHHPWQLSGGMQQRVSIARALAFDPALLLMDEPFGALDEMTRERMNLELQNIWDRTGATIVFVTHSIPEAVFLSNRVVMLSPRPGCIAEIVDIDLPMPRAWEVREDPHYFELVNHLRDTLREIEGGMRE
ncbi:MAG: ABC transporter ATP-binding protein [Chloroflexi bacterium]|nr:ABC transporter ATP-binding protein [Chloroflexota bacterium]